MTYQYKREPLSIEEAERILNAAELPPAPLASPQAGKRSAPITAASSGPSRATGPTQLAGDGVGRRQAVVVMGWKRGDACQNITTLTRPARMRRSAGIRHDMGTRHRKPLKDGHHRLLTERAGKHSVSGRVWKRRVP